MPGKVQRQVDKDVHTADKGVRGVDEDVSAVVTRFDPYWGGQLVIAAAILLDLSLADQLTFGPGWLLPALEGAALVGLTMAAPHPRMRDSLLRRRLALTLIAIVTAANCYSLVMLVRYLVAGGQAHAHALIGSGVVLWVTNVLLFGVWFWQLDGGGPRARHRRRNPHPDFLFVQMTEPQFAPHGWHPTLVDYLYTSFTNATAFSPTDTMPLTPMAKALMTVQSITALTTIGLVVARAVNIL
ncbi:MAG TPA: hypothetical protein VMF14_05295 [Solirubrobacteraceae bacterium]|nr:hypothetical protein [Solirubrobacteraceae bacterium]